MRIALKAVPGAKMNMMKQTPQGLVIYLTAPAVDGKANKALIEFLADHYEVAKSRVQIIRGEASRHKVVNIDE